VAFEDVDRKLEVANLLLGVAQIGDRRPSKQKKPRSQDQGSYDAN